MSKSRPSGKGAESIPKLYWLLGGDGDPSTRMSAWPSVKFSVENSVCNVHQGVPVCSSWSVFDHLDFVKGPSEELGAVVQWKSRGIKGELVFALKVDEDRTREYYYN